MARTIVTLRVVLDFDPEDVEQSEDFDASTQTARDYLRGALAGFVENEVNNCNDFPATAYVETIPDLTGTVTNLQQLARRLEDERDAARRVVRDRLEYLRGELRRERMSYGELADLQGLAPFIDRDDVELLEAAGVPEHDEMRSLDADPAPSELGRELHGNGVHTHCPAHCLSLWDDEGNDRA